MRNVYVKLKPLPICVICFFLHGLDDFCGPCQEVFQKQHLRNWKDKHRRGYRLASLTISPDIVPNTFCRPLDVDFQIILYWFAIWIQSSVLWTEDTLEYKIREIGRQMHLFHFKQAVKLQCQTVSKNIDFKCIKWSAEQHRRTGKVRCALLELMPCLTSLDNPKNDSFVLANEIYFKWLGLEGSSWLSNHCAFSGTFSYKLDMQWERSCVLCIRVIWNNIIQHLVSHAPNQMKKKSVNHFYI